MRIAVFIDLDDTLFQSQRKCPVNDELTPAAQQIDGRIQAFMTAKQHTLWQCLNDHALVIPTTARDLTALRCVLLPFHHWQIIDFGAVILNSNAQPDADWLARTHSVAQTTEAELHQLITIAQHWITANTLALRLRYIKDFEIPLYVVAKYTDDQLEQLDLLEQAVFVPWVAERSHTYQVHRNGNNLAVLPRAFDKVHAVRYLIEQFTREWGDVLTIGIGDSRSDGAFMAACDYAMLPHGSQIFTAWFNELRPTN